MNYSTYFRNVRSIDAIVSGRQFGWFVTARAAVFVAAAIATTAVSARVRVAVRVTVLGASARTASSNAVRILIWNGDTWSVADV